MDPFKTPLKQKQQLSNSINIPPSPFLQKIGYGTGVAVYNLQRSPICNKLRSPWAIKKLIKRSKKNAELDKRIMTEAEILKKLNHPNIVGFRAFVKGNDGRNVLVMEQCSCCLGDLIEQRNDEGLPPYPANLIETVAKDISKALNYLHNTALLLHCDVKSYNVLIKGNFEVCKLCDFGVCLPLKTDGTLDEKKAGDETGFVGTLAWSAPEILNFPQTITAKADIYAFGLVIWEMIALMPPVDEKMCESLNESLDSTIDQSERQRPALPDVDLDAKYNFVLELFYRCTEADIGKRMSSKVLVRIFDKMEGL